MIAATTGTHEARAFAGKLAEARANVLMFIEKKEPRLACRAQASEEEDNYWYDGFDAFLDVNVGDED